MNPELRALFAETDESLTPYWNKPIGKTPAPSATNLAEIAPSSANTPAHFCYSPQGMTEIDAIVMHHFANRPALTGFVELDALKSEQLKNDHAPHLLRLRYGYDDLRNYKKGKIEVARMLFKMPDGAFVDVQEHCGKRIAVTAPTRQQVTHWLAHFVTRYAKRTAKRPKPTFSIISFDSGRPDTTEVDITRNFALPADIMQLLYGDEFLTWEKSLTTKMKFKDTGVLLFQGPPGTGKTSFIRHLIDKLKKTHRFYYMPVTNQELLTSPHMVDFWARECGNNADKKKVIILEDAELLLERGQYGRSGAVANLLNIADGLLGELLKVQLLCTINCDISNLDEAIIRPGRLLDYREFPRLAPAHARRIAEKYSKTLPDLPDYALSDIFGTKLETAPNPAPQRRVMGFAAGIL